MQHTSIDGVVLKVNEIGDHDCYLTILSAARGRFLLLSKGGRGFRNEKVAISQYFVYGNFEYYRKGDTNVLKGGQTHRQFFAKGTDCVNLWLTTYLSDVICELTDTDTAATDETRLMLNTLCAIEEERRPLPIIKGAFEWRMAALAGYAPDLHACHTCGAHTADPFYLNVMNGELLCEQCLRKKEAAPQTYDSGTGGRIDATDTLCPISPSVLAALRYVKEAPLSRLYSFALKDEQERTAFSKVCELYLLSHLGKSFPSLESYHRHKNE